jgi:putative tricarboxylic transport membrane protein
MPFGPLILSAVGLGAIAMSWTYGLWSFGSPGAGLMPAAAGALLVCASAAEIRLAAPRWPTFSRRLLAHAGALILLPFASLGLGMLVALATYVVAVLYVIEGRRLLSAAGIAGLATAGCWLLFEKLLSVPLPKPLFV